MAATKATASAQTRMRASQMGLFVWEGTDKRGTKMKGESQSKSANLVRAELRKQDITPTVVKEKAKPMFGAAGSRITALEIATFSRQIATMLQSGVPMVQSFEILSGGQKNERMRIMLSDIRDSISGGSTLYEALGRFMVSYWWAMLLVSIGTVVGYLAILRRSAKMREMVDRGMLKL